MAPIDNMLKLFGLYITPLFRSGIGSLVVKLKHLSEPTPFHLLILKAVAATGAAKSLQQPGACMAVVWSYSAPDALFTSPNNNSLMKSPFSDSLLLAFVGSYGGMTR